MSLRTTSFLPPTASRSRFQPRLWFRFVPLEDDARGRSVHFWALLIENDGPELHDAVLELHGTETVDHEETHALGSIAEHGCAWVFLGGPSPQPPYGHYRLWAKGLAGAPVFLEAVCSAAPNDARAAQAGLGVAGPWLPSEYVRALEDSRLFGARSEIPAATAFADWWNERAEMVPGQLSLPAAKEAAWSGLQAVFGAAEGDRGRADVERLLERLAVRFESSLRLRAERRPSLDRAA